MLVKYTEEIANLLYPLRAIIIEEEVINLVNKWQIIRLRECCKNATKMTQYDYNNLLQYATDTNNIELEKNIIGHHIVDYVRHLTAEEWRTFYNQFASYSNNRDV